MPTAIFIFGSMPTHKGPRMMFPSRHAGRSRAWETHATVTWRLAGTFCGGCLCRLARSASAASLHGDEGRGRERRLLHRRRQGRARSRRLMHKPRHEDKKEKQHNDGGASQYHVERRIRPTVRASPAPVAAATKTAHVARGYPGVLPLRSCPLDFHGADSTTTLPYYCSGNELL